MVKLFTELELFERFIMTDNALAEDGIVRGIKLPEHVDVDKGEHYNSVLIIDTNILVPAYVHEDTSVTSYNTEV